MPISPFVLYEDGTSTSIKKICSIFLPAMFDTVTSYDVDRVQLRMEEPINVSIVYNINDCVHKKINNVYIQLM